MSVAVESLARRYEALRPHLTERQRRLWLGAEARELGSGGAVVVAQAVGVAADTVRRGRAELDDPAPPPVGVSRRPGGGRKRAETHDPELVAALERLVDPDSRGDPMSPLRWTSKSTRALAEAGHQVSDFVVRRLLKALGYSLQANAKTSEGRQHLDRDAQFSYLNEQVKAHQRGPVTGPPQLTNIASVDGGSHPAGGATHILPILTVDGMPHGSQRARFSVVVRQRKGLSTSLQGHRPHLLIAGLTYRCLRAFACERRGVVK